MSQRDHTAEVMQSDSTITSHNNHPILNRLLLGSDVAILSALLLLRFTSITQEVTTVIGIIIGVFGFLFPTIRKFHQQAWFQSQVMTTLLSIILGTGLTLLIYPYLVNVLPNAKDTSNILVNGDFEQSIYQKRWDWSDSAEVNWDNGYTGHGLCIKQTASQAQSEPAWALIYQQIQVAPSQQYRFAAYMKWINATQAHLKVDWYTADDKWVDWDLLSPIVDGSSGGWISQNKTVTAPADATHAAIVALHGVIDNQTNIPGGSLCVDNIVFEPYSTP